MLFDNWKQYKDNQISPSLLWEYDLSDFDWNAGRTLVMQRVIERGRMADYFAALNLYGGMENVREIIKSIPTLSPKDVTFVCKVFQIEKEELRCCTRKRLREKLMSD